MLNIIFNVPNKTHFLSLYFIWYTIYAIGYGIRGNTMQYYKTISKIRINKGIKVLDLLNNNMSRSSYNRYVSGQTDIYSQHFLDLLDQLHISVSELDVIANNYRYSEKDVIFQKVTMALKNKDFNELYLIYKKVKSLANQKQNDFYTHISEILVLILNCSKISSSFNIEESYVYYYLLQAFVWTDYEFKLFSLMLPFLTATEVEPFSTKIEHFFKKLGHSTFYSKQYFDLLCDVTFYFIHHQNYDRALHYIFLLESCTLPEDLVYEQMLLIFFTNLKKLLFFPATTYSDSLKDCITTAKFLKMYSLAEKFEKTISEIISK